MQCLSPNEIRCLSKSNGHRTDDAVYIKSCGGIVEKLIADDYLVVGTKEQSLSHSDMNIIRKLLKDKGLKAGGKKVDLIQRIFENYTKEEIENIDIPKRFVLTDRGEKVICENKALIYYFNAFGATNILEPEQIVHAQNLYPNNSEFDILIRLFKEKVTMETNIGKKRVITAHLAILYRLNHDDTLACEADIEIEKLDKLWEIEREQEARRMDSVFGISLEERQRLQQQVIDEMDDEWEKELDAWNKAKAGIE